MEKAAECIEQQHERGAYDDEVDKYVSTLTEQSPAKCHEDVLADRRQARRNR